MPLKDGSVSRSSKILAVEAFGNLVFFLVVVHLLVCSFFAPLTIPLHFSFTSITDLLETPSAMTLSVITSHTRLLCFLESVAEILHLIILIFFFHFFENNCPFGKCKLSFFSALCRGRSNILCRVFSPLGL